MQYVIVEDEFHAAKRLQSLVKTLRPDSSVLALLDSVEDSIQWFSSHPSPDLIFMDIQLADGLSLDIFNHVKIESPVIFTTAFDDYALKAFKTNSVDYLLKPVDEAELQRAMEKFEKYFGKKNLVIDPAAIRQILSSALRPEYVTRFIVRNGTGFGYISVDDIGFFYSEEGITYLCTVNKKKHHVDYTLEQLDEILEPEKFFRVNRKLIVSIKSVHQVSEYFNNRLKLRLQPESSFEAIVSRDRVKQFKQWLGA